MTVDELRDMSIEHGSVVDAARATGLSGEMLLALEGVREDTFNKMQDTNSRDERTWYRDQLAFIDADLSALRTFHYSTGTPPLTPGGSYVGRMGATI